ncbi:hypothetical protein [Burkholderia ubonensis]|uniref:hypothetical protein n=1 Tax=Burkholderia ubonensis TaxID=101571 RepID=UPI0012FA8343|nr:hypothetical protein [Burkholderia ubonensis]
MTFGDHAVTHDDRADHAELFDAGGDLRYLRFGVGARVACIGDEAVDRAAGNLQGWTFFIGKKRSQQQTARPPPTTIYGQPDFCKRGSVDLKWTCSNLSGVVDGKDPAP